MWHVYVAIAVARPVAVRNMYAVARSAMYRSGHDGAHHERAEYLSEFARLADAGGG
jgi:hypothetical protein